MSSLRGLGPGRAATNSTASIIPFPRARPLQVGFERPELQRILDLYGRMVAAGEWRDYAIHFAHDSASFVAFCRSTERPQAWIENRPGLRQRQGMWTLYGEAGQVLKRGHELAGVLVPLERKLLKVVGS